MPYESIALTTELQAYGTGGRTRTRTDLGLSQMPLPDWATPARVDDGGV